MKNEKFTILNFKSKKESGKRITMLTAYDAPMANVIDSAGIDSILVGDSVGMVLLGYESTTPVTMDEMIHHAKAARKGTKRAFLIGDMPFLSYQASNRDAVRNAGRFIKEAGCEAVKIEGAGGMIPRVRAITSSGVPVLGHIGLTPQSVNKFGGYKVQGKDDKSAKLLMDDALLLEKAGCFAIVLECVPAELAKKITTALKIPTIGIGAGKYCDGQVLVTHDIIGYSEKPSPKFVKKYANINLSIKKSVESFKKETKSGRFPDAAHSY